MTESEKPATDTPKADTPDIETPAAAATKPDTPKVKPKKNRRGWLILVSVVLIGLIAFFLFLEFAVPVRLESLIADKLQSSLNLKKKPVVKVDMFPAAVKIFTGRIDRVYFKAENATLNEGFPAKEVETEIKGIRFDPLRVLKTRQPSIKGMDEGWVKIVLSEQTVNALVADRFPGAVVKLEKGRFHFTGEMTFSDPAFVIDILGSIVVLRDNRLGFRPQVDQIAALPVSQEVKDYLMNALTTEYKVDNMPQGLTLTGVTLNPGTLTIECSIDALDDLVVGGTI